MTNVGIIGAGMIGSAVMRLAVAAGHRVSIANSRGPGSLESLVRTTSGGAVATTVEQIGSSSELVVFAAPLSSYASFPPESFADRTVVDTSNYYPDRFGRIAALDESGLPSSAFLQNRWSRARLVKALNTMDYVRLEALAARPADVVTAVPIAGDEPTAVADVSEFVRSIGFDPLPAGSLRDSRRFEPGTPLHVQAYLRMPEDGVDAFDRFTRATAVPVSAERTRALLRSTP